MIVGIDLGITNTDVAVYDKGQIRQTWRVASPLAMDGDFVRSLLTAHRLPLTQIDRLVLTGGRPEAFPAALEGVPLQRVSEIAAIGQGGLVLSGLNEATVVSAGSGVAVVAARPGQFQHVTGTAVGGGTLLGLARLLLNTSDPDEVNSLALSGDPAHVDITIQDVLGGPVGRLPANANAVNFGRLARTGAVPRREDVATGLVRMVAQVIAVIAINAAAAQHLLKIVVVGHLVDLPAIRKELSLVATWYGADISIPENPGTATVVGALTLATMDDGR